MTPAENASVPAPRAQPLREGPVQGSVHSAAGTLGPNRGCLWGSRAAFYPGPRSRRNPTQKLGCVFSLRHSFLWFEERRFQISPISSENSFNTTTLPQQQLQSFIGVFPLHEGRGGQDDIIDQLLINSLVFFFFFSFQENHSHPPIAWFRRKQDGRRAVC